MSISNGLVWKLLPCADWVETEDVAGEEVDDALSNWTISSPLPAQKVVAVVDKSGSIHVIERSADRGLRLKASFVPFERRASAVTVSDAEHAGGTRRLCVLAVGLDHSDSLLKVWQIESDHVVSLKLQLRIDSTNFVNQAPPSAQSKLSNSRVSTVAASRGGRIVVTGFLDGSLSIAWSGDHGHPTFAEAQRNQIRQLRVPTAPGEPASPIVHLSLHSSCKCVFVVSGRCICVVQLPLSDEKSVTSCSLDLMRKEARREILELRGVSSPSLVAVVPYQPSTPESILVALPEGLYFYHLDGIGASIPHQTPGDAKVAFLDSFLLVATETSVIGFDVTSKLAILDQPLESEAGSLSFMFSGQGRKGGVYGLTMHSGNRKMRGLSMRSANERVRLLVRHEMFTLALKLAEQDDPDTVKWVVRENAKHELQAGRVDRAAELFADLIDGDLDVSSIIRSLIAAGQRAIKAGSNALLKTTNESLQKSSRAALENFLEALHFKGFANEHHTRLLISCYRADAQREFYTDQSSDQILRRFISSVSNSSVEEVDRTIACCREANLYDSAKALAENRERYLLLACILIFDAGDVPGTIVLIDRLVARELEGQSQTDFDRELLNIFDMVGRRLAAEDPQGLVDVMMKFLEKGGPDNACHVEQFCDSFVDCPHWQHQFLNRALDWISRSDPYVTTDVSETLHTVWMRYLEVLIQLDSLGGHSQDHLEGGPNFLCDARSCPRAYFKSCNSSVEFSPRKGTGAIEFVKNSRVQVDGRQALNVSVSSGGNPECDTYLLESTKQYARLGVLLSGRDDADKLIRACRRYGSREPMLWIDALAMFVRKLERWRSGEESEADYSRALGGLREVIIAIDRTNALTPIELVEILSNGGLESGAPFESFQEYFNKIVSARRREAEKDEHQVSQLRSDKRKLELNLKRLKGEAIIFRQRKCGMCENLLELPVVHFLCEHSFHAECLTVGGTMGFTDTRPISSGAKSSNRSSTGNVGSWSPKLGTKSPQSRLRQPKLDPPDQEWQCPICTPSHESAVSVRAAMEARNTRHEEFFKEIRSGGGFTTVLERLSQQGLAP